MCFNHAHDIILYSITDLNVMELILAIKYVAVVFTICLHDMSEKKGNVILYSHQANHQGPQRQIKALHV